MRQLDLEPALARLRPLAEDLQDERRAVEHLGVPGLLEIALLDRRELGVDDDDLGLERQRFRLDLVDLAAADQRRGHRTGERRDVAGDDAEPDRDGQPDGLFETRLSVAVERALASLRLDMEHEGGALARVDGLGGGQAVSATVSASISWIGPSGMTVEIACL